MIKFLIFNVGWIIQATNGPLQMGLTHKIQVKMVPGFIATKMNCSTTKTRSK